MNKVLRPLGGLRQPIQDFEISWCFEFCLNIRERGVAVDTGNISGHGLMNKLQKTSVAKMGFKNVTVQ